MLSFIGETEVFASKTKKSEVVYPNVVNRIGDIGYNIHDVYSVESFKENGKSINAKNMFLVVTMTVENYSDKTYELNLNDIYVNEKEYIKCRSCTVNYSKKATKRLNSKNINKTKIETQKAYTFTVIFDLKEDVVSNRNLKLSIKNSSDYKNKKRLDVLVYSPYVINISNIFDNKGMNDINENISVMSGDEAQFLQVLNDSCGDTARVMYSSDAQAYIIYLLIPEFKMHNVFGEMVIDGGEWYDSYNALVSSFLELYRINYTTTGSSGIIQFRDIYNQPIFSIVNGTLQEHFERPKN